MDLDDVLAAKVSAVNVWRKIHGRCWFAGFVKGLRCGLSSPAGDACNIPCRTLVPLRGGLR